MSVLDILIRYGLFQIYFLCEEEVDLQLPLLKIFDIASHTSTDAHLLLDMASDLERAWAPAVKQLSTELHLPQVGAEVPRSDCWARISLMASSVASICTSEYLDRNGIKAPPYLSLLRTALGKADQFSTMS